MKFNNKVPKWLIVLGCVAGILLMIASTIETVMLFKSMATGWMAYMFATVGFCIDIGKTVTFALFVFFAIKKKFWSSLLFLTFYTLCLVISMVASQSLDLNKANEIQNNTITASDEYTFSKSTIDSSESDIQRYLTDIKSLESSEQARIQQAIEHLQAEKQAAQKKRWLTTPAGSPRRGVDVIESDIAKVKQNVREQLQYEIQSLKDDIKSSRKSQNNAKSAISSLKNGGGTLTTSGLIAFSEWINPENPTKTLARFNIFKNIFREILGTLLILLFNYNFDSVQSRTRAEFQPKQSKQTDELSKVRLSKVSNDEYTPSKEEIANFLKVKKANPKLGYKHIAPKIGVAQNKAGKIQKYLKEKGILISEGNYTKIG